MAFKIGQRVVFIDRGVTNINMVKPKNNEIVTIERACDHFPYSYHLTEYPFSKNGNTQSFHKMHLRPLDYDFAERILQQVRPQTTKI